MYQNNTDHHINSRIVYYDEWVENELSDIPDEFIVVHRSLSGIEVDLSDAGSGDC